MKKRKIAKSVIIGVDGGGTKTIALAVDFDGKVLGTGNAGPSSPRNEGIEKSAEAVVLAIEKSVSKIKEKKILSVFIGLAAIQEDYKNRKEEIKKEILKRSRILSKIKKNVFIESDQDVAFRSGTDEKNGIVVIAGTGCVARGWNNKKDIEASAWGWLADEGSACWVGHRVYQEITKSMDERSKKTILADLVLKKFKIKNPTDLSKLVYKEHPVKILSQLSLITDTAAKKGDKTAKDILNQAGRELALSAFAVAKQLKFKDRFPLVLVGGMFNSQIVLKSFKKEIKNYNLNAKILMPSALPVWGAVKLAEEKLHENRKS